MALIMYLTRAPRYKNTTTDTMRLIEMYLEWQHENRIHSKYSCDTFEEWCGKPESVLPSKDVIDYYSQFYTIKEVYEEGYGKEKTYSVFEQLARFVKASQIFKWFVDNIVDFKIKQHYEIAKEQLENLLNTCIKVKDSFEQYNGHYIVDKDVAEALLPVMSIDGIFFGTDSYKSIYAEQIIQTIECVNNILATTDFTKESIYFYAFFT